MMSRMSRKACGGVVLMVLAACLAAFAQEERGGAVAHDLSEFGPVATPVQAQAAFQKATEELLAAGGGVLLIGADAAEGWVPENISQQVWRQPQPPAHAERWGTGPALTVIDTRKGTVNLHVPQVSGMEITRLFNMPDGQSSPHWSYHPAVYMRNSIVRGSTSYLEWLQEDVEAGQDRRFYMETIRGLFPGMFINAHGAPGYGTPVGRLVVKALGYDREKDMPYFVADTPYDHPTGAIMHNKTHTNALKIETFSHNENQTFDVMNWRHEYSQGDTYMYDARFAYMSDVHSTAGDENGVLYAAFVESLTNTFRGRVESWIPQTGELKYTGAANAHTLGTGRPVINLSPAKWMTGDDAIIVRPGSWFDFGDHVKDPVFEGKTYPTTLVADPRTSVRELRMGGLIRFPAGSPVSQEVVGRYLAVDEPDEYVPATSVRRWYMICGFQADPDGTKRISIIRHWWGAKPADAPTLYNPDNYSRDGHVKLLRYIIAAGANVYDVSRGVRSGTAYASGALDRIIKLAPGPHEGTEVDFAPGDPIEQAIGPDPFRPIPFRTWLFESVPGAWPAPVFDVANLGAISRYAVMTVAGGPAAMEAVGNRADKTPPWQHYLIFSSAADRGIVFDADVADSAIEFGQPNSRPQPIKWRHAGGTASLTVWPQTGDMEFSGGNLSTGGGSLLKARGVSATETVAKNLRGIDVPVSQGADSMTIEFTAAEADSRYAVCVEPSWLTNHAVAAKTADGFTISFSQAAPEDARLDWILIR